MNSLENVTLALQCIQNLEGLRKDMRDNAVAYKQYATGKTQRVAEVMTRDAQEYIRRIGWVRTFIADAAKRAKLVDGLQRLGIVVSEAAGYVTELENAAIAQRDAPKNNAQQIIAAADAVLASVAYSDRMY